LKKSWKAVKKPERPPANRGHLPLLKQFMSVASGNSAHKFQAMIGTATASQFVSLFSLVLSVCRPRSSPVSNTAMDYSAVDMLCSVFGQCDLEVMADALCTVIPWAVHAVPLGLFRLLHGLLDRVLVDATREMLILFAALSPRAFPKFANCWIQLVMHPNALSVLFDRQEQPSVSFCVDFVATCLKLATSFPEVFYRPVARVLLAIAEGLPMLFVAYFAFFIDDLPPHFVQFRNIILGAAPPFLNESDDPPIGFDFVSELRELSLLAPLQGYLDTQKSLGFPPNQGHVEFVSAALRRRMSEAGPVVISRFVLYTIVESCIKVQPSCLELGSENFRVLPIVNLYVGICQRLNDLTVKTLFTAIVDNVRFPSQHTSWAANLVLTLFRILDVGLRDALFVVVARRVLCVSQPPAAILAVYEQIGPKFAAEGRKRQAEVLKGMQSVAGALAGLR
jgi:hypothetical protein